MMEKLKIMLEDDRLTVASILVKNGYIVRQMKERVEGKKSYAYYLEYGIPDREEDRE